MSHVGRPTKLETGDRQRLLLQELAKRTLASDALVKSLSKELKVGAAAVRGDLERLAAGSAEATRIPFDLAADLANASTHEELLKVERQLVAEIGLRRVSPQDATFFLGACRELRQTLERVRRSEQPLGDFLAAPETQS